MPTKPRTIDEYLARLSDEKRLALESLRRAIQRAAPGAEECISYDLPTFKLDGKMLVSFGAWASYCSFYAGVHPIETHRDRLAGYDTSKGTIRFSPAKPLPVTLVTALVKARVAERGKRESSA